VGDHNFPVPAGLGFDFRFTVAPPLATPGSIHASPPPAPIPDEIVFGFFLRITSCADTDPEVHKHACALAIQKLWLDASDERTLRHAAAANVLTLPFQEFRAPEIPPRTRNLLDPCFSPAQQ